MFTAATALLMLFTTIASVDGFYFHLYKYRLWERPQSRREHLLHTVNSCLFPLSLAPLFLATSTGAWLWFALAMNLVTLAIESLDVFEEHASRADLGGLTSTEYWMHFMMSGLRWGFVVLTFASQPFEAWHAETAWIWRVPASVADLVTASGWGVTLLGLPVALLHVGLAMRPARSTVEVHG